MECRKNFGLRKLIDLSLRLVDKGVISVEHAAEAMEHAGAPFAVVGRVLSPYRVATPTIAGSSRQTVAGMAY